MFCSMQFNEFQIQWSYLQGIRIEYKSFLTAENEIISFSIIIIIHSNFPIRSTRTSHTQTNIE